MMPSDVSRLRRDIGSGWSTVSLIVDEYDEQWTYMNNKGKVDISV